MSLNIDTISPISWILALDVLSGATQGQERPSSYHQSRIRIKKDRDETEMELGEAYCVLTAVKLVNISLSNLKCGQETRWKSGHSPCFTADIFWLLLVFVTLLIPTQLQSSACANDKRLSEGAGFPHGQAIDCGRLFHFGSSFPTSQSPFFLLSLI